MGVNSTNSYSSAALFCEFEMPSVNVSQLYHSSHFWFLDFGHFWQWSCENTKKCVIFIYISQGKMDKMKNKPERVFGLQVRCRELDIFKIRNFFRNCLEIFWIYQGFFWGIFWIFLGFFIIFGGIFWEEFFGRIFWEGFFLKIFLGGFFGRIFRRMSMECDKTFQKPNCTECCQNLTFKVD